MNESLRKDRRLFGIELDVEEQVQKLDRFDFNEELLKFPITKTVELEFYYNGSYASGDAECLYNMIRFFKLKKIIEIGCGNSTLMAQNAIAKNKLKDLNYNCQHICIEP